MNLDELILRLNQMAVNGGMNCLGCGYEAGCGMHGCAVLKRAAELLSDMQWRQMEVEVPQEDQEVLVIASGKPRPNLTLQDAICMASWSSADGWMLDEFPEWDGAEVKYWMPLPPEPDPERIEYGKQVCNLDAADLCKPIPLEKLRAAAAERPVLVYVLPVDENGATVDEEWGEWEMFFHGSFVADGTYDTTDNYGHTFVAFWDKPGRNKRAHHHGSR